MTSSHPALADFLDTRRDAITSEWLVRVRRDRKIPSADDLPRAELIDHMPFLLTALIERLRGTPHAGSETTRQSQVHGETRANQNYRLPELLLEVSILRNVLIEVWVEFDATNSPDRHVQLESSAILHAILDGVIAESTAGFVGRQQEELLAANRALEEAHQQAEALNVELAALDERRLRTLRTISHEIANHLNAAGLMLSLLKRSPDPETFETSTAALTRGIGAMTELMKQLLEFSQLASAAETAAPKSIELRTLFEDLAGFAGTLATERGLEFTGELDPRLDRVITDPGILRRICLNLVTNAIKYTTVGRVRMAFEPHHGASQWRVVVTDTGRGIPTEEQSRIFDEFYRGHASSEGSPGVGLGLAITRQLVALLNGRIEFESAVGHGSTFRVILPRE